jgi:hypothetical protein
MLFVMYRKINRSWKPIGYTWDSELEADIRERINRYNENGRFSIDSVCAEADTGNLPALTWEMIKDWIF